MKRNDALFCEMSFRERSSLAVEAMDTEAAILWRWMAGRIFAMGCVFEAIVDHSVPRPLESPWGFTLRRIDEVVR